MTRTSGGSGETRNDPPAKAEEDLIPLADPEPAPRRPPRRPVPVVPRASPAPGPVTPPLPHAPAFGPRKLGYAGPVPRNRADRATAIAEEQREQAMWDWLTPLLMLGGSAVALMIMPLIWARSFDVEDAAIMGIAVLVMAVIKTMAALLMALAIALLLGTGFDSFGRETLRLAAVVMTATAVTAAVAPCLGCFSLLVYIGLIVVMMMTMLDLEQGEAIGFAIAFLIAETAGFLFLDHAINALFGL